MRTHPIVEYYQALRDSAPCLSRAATLPKGTKLGLGKRRAPGNTIILSQPYRRRVSTDRLNREGSQLAASLEGEPGPTPAGKTLPHSFPETSRFRRERARDYSSLKTEQYTTVGFSPIFYCYRVCYLRHWGTRLNPMKSFCPCSQCSHVNILMISPPDGVDASKGLDASGFSFNRVGTHYCCVPCAYYCTCAPSVFVLLCCSPRTVYRIFCELREWVPKSVELQHTCRKLCIV